MDHTLLVQRIEFLEKAVEALQQREYQAKSRGKERALQREAAIASLGEERQYLQGENESLQRKMQGLNVHVQDLHNELIALRNSKEEAQKGKDRLSKAVHNQNRILTEQRRETKANTTELSQKILHYEDLLRKEKQKYEDLLQKEREKNEEVSEDRDLMYEAFEDQADHIAELVLKNEQQAMWMGKIMSDLMSKVTAKARAEPQRKDQATGIKIAPPRQKSPFVGRARSLSEGALGKIVH